MARQKKQKPEPKLDGWMATFSDLVTLLFCFFVLLYAMSSTDETKIQYIFQTMASGGEYLNLIVKDTPPTDSEETGSTTPGATIGDEPGGGSTESDFEELLNYIVQAASTSDFSDSIQVEGTSGKIRIKFDNDVLFDSDSYILKDSGRRALGVITPGLKALQNCIATIQVQGHTADINLVGQMSPVNDWDLSSLRAAAVIKHMDFQRTVSSEKFMSEGYAQFHPLVPNDTPEGRAENRRVEILVIRKPDFQGSELFGDIMKYDYNQFHWQVDADGNRIDSGTLDTPDVVQQIVDTIKENHESAKSGKQESESQPGLAVGNNMIDIPESDYVPQSPEVSEDSTAVQQGEETAEETE